MPIIDRVGRKSKKVKILTVVMYIVLTLGAITMVYPCLIMLSSSITSAIDMNEFRIIPKYLYDDEVLYRKYLQIRYGNIETLNQYHRKDYINFEEKVEYKEEALTIQKINFIKNRIEDVEEFKERIPENYKSIWSVKTGKLYHEFLKKRYNKDIKLIAKKYQESIDNFYDINPPQEYTHRSWKPEYIAQERDWKEFKNRLSSEYFKIVITEGVWQQWLKEKYENDIGGLNKEWEANYSTFFEIKLEERMPDDNIGKREDWVKFVKIHIPLHWIEIDKSSNKKLFCNYLEKNYKNINKLNKTYQRNYESFGSIDIPDLSTKDSSVLWREYGGFISDEIPDDAIRVITVENMYREFLKRKYKDIVEINTRYGTNYTKFDDIVIPYQEIDEYEFIRDKNKWRGYFITNNYEVVTDYILLKGRAGINTIIYCLAVILTSLTIHPLCAYALSRFNLKSTYEILLFLLATMAFPAEVAMIPNFLLLKQFNLLNTYWALILPGLAGGFGIFLLKGFFDSLPKELYEAGEIDGAGELKMFFKITLPLSKPILAHTALGAFTAAYGAFMYALLVCQDPKMWTLMVWLYEMHIWAPAHVQMAAFVAASIPTLIIFMSCQRIIMRGIILPIEN